MQQQQQQQHNRKIVKMENCMNENESRIQKKIEIKKTTVTNRKENCKTGETLKVTLLHFETILEFFHEPFSNFSN